MITRAQCDIISRIVVGNFERTPYERLTDSVILYRAYVENSPLAEDCLEDINEVIRSLQSNA